jgi:hypothetical protein
MVEEARLERLDAGLTPVTEGWFVVNVRDAAWVTNDVLGSACTFEGESTPPFGEIGFTLGVLRPRKPSALYHRESNQEDCLVPAGECLLLIEGEERGLRAWTSCTSRRRRITSSSVRATVHARSSWRAGARARSGSPTHTRSSTGAGVKTETSAPREAYAPFPKWQQGPPESWDGLPWA